MSDRAHVEISHAEILRAETLTHRFPDGKEGLAGVDLAVHEGEFLLLAGRNGSGKTLLVRHFVGLSTPSSGRVLYRGRPVGECLREVRRAVGFVFQDTESQILGQTVAEDLAFGPANLRLDRREISFRVDESLAIARLEGMKDRRPETLSGGEKRRLAVAAVLAMRPECLILDEPFANLDLESVRDILRLFADLKTAGKTLIILTHELEKTVHLADRLAIMDKGRIVYDGKPDDPDPGLYLPHGLADPYAQALWSSLVPAAGSSPPPESSPAPASGDAR
ncbi:MAG: ABC transporter ATP-binding protein [Rectinemataceae bacterium]